jgi:hypothetical protein
VSFQIALYSTWYQNKFGKSDVMPSRAFEKTFAKIVKLWKAQSLSTGLKDRHHVQDLRPIRTNQTKEVGKIMSNPYEGDSLTMTEAGLTGTNTGSGGNGRGIGVLGKSANGEGVHGETSSTQYAAVAGIELNSNSNIAAVYGEQRGNGPGIYGFAKGQGHGVFGHSETGEGVHGETNSTQYAAVAGITFTPSGIGAGVYGQSLGQGPGVFGTSASGLAGQFQGDVEITGNLTVQGEDFADKIATIKEIFFSLADNFNLRAGYTPAQLQQIQSL